MIDDLSGNSYAGITYATDLNFTTIAAADTTDPTMNPATAVPADNATAIGLNANIILTFSEAIQVGTGNIIIRSGGAAVETIDVTSGQVTVVGNQLIINPTTTLTALTAYAVQIAATAVDDLNGNSYAGIADDTTLNFTTEAADAGKTWSVSDAVVTEVSGESAVVTINLNSASASDLTVDYATTNGTATHNSGTFSLTADANNDYTTTSGTLTIAAGDISGTFEIPIYNDQLYEGSETITVTLTNQSAGSLLDATGTVTITDNELSGNLGTGTNASTQ